MIMGLEALTAMEYPGRFIILGADRDALHTIVVYGITGRSPSSKARKMVHDKMGRKVSVVPTDEEILKTGNLDLLVYDAILYEKGIAVSNGKQTNDAALFGAKSQPGKNAPELLGSLAIGLNRWDYEPDAPTHTPRITGVVNEIRYNFAFFNIIRRSVGREATNSRHYFQFPLIPGQGKLITTYTGENRDPLPSFTGEPLDVVLPQMNAYQLANDVYNALTPRNPTKDYRVAVAVVYSRFECPPDVHIINRCDMGAK